MIFICLFLLSFLFSFAPAICQNCTNVSFPKCEILVYDICVAPLFTLYPKDLSSCVSSFLAKGDKQHNSIKYLSPLSQCLHVFYPFPFLLPLEIFAIVFLLFIPRVTSVCGLNICLFLFVLPVQIGFLCFW